MALTPLPNTFWVDAQSTGAGGTAATQGAVSAFSTISAALAAFAPAGSVGRLLVVQGDYSAGGVAVDPSATVIELSVDGIGGAQNAASAPFLPPLVNATPIIGTLRGVTVTPDAGLVAASGFQNLFAEDVTFTGNVDATNAIVARETLFNLGTVTSLGTSVFTECDASGGNVFSTPLALIDLHSFINFGNRGVTRSDGANDAIWTLSLTSPASAVNYAALQDADRAVVFANGSIAGGVWCSRNSLTANRVVTVNVATAPDLGLFRVYNFGQLAGGFTLTVNGTLCPDFMLSTFQVQAGVLTLLSTEFI